MDKNSTGFVENNVVTTTWEFRTEDLDFSLYGYFTSTDEDLGVNQCFQGSIYFRSLLKKFYFSFCLFSLLFFPLGLMQS